MMTPHLTFAHGDPLASFMPGIDGVLLLELWL